MNFGYKPMYIDGKLKDARSGERKAVTCPGTEAICGEVAWADRAEAEEALQSAQRGLRNWSGQSIQERSRWIYLLRDAVIAREEDLRSAIMYEMGKTWEETASDYQALPDALDWYAQEIRRTRDCILPDMDGTFHHQVISQPVGVVAAFLAWNFPLLNVGYKLGPALAAGCSIILRPSSSSPLSAYILGEICHEVSFPAGVINILGGPVSSVASTISRSSIPRLVTMIGSSETGRLLTAQSATSIKRMGMELGGNAPVLVFPDADVETAARDMVGIKFVVCGQTCISPNRFFIHQDVYKRFRDEFVVEAGKVRAGFGRELNPTMGPLINAGARERVEGLVSDAVTKGARIALGGQRPEALTKGYFYSPTVLENVTSDMRVFREEIFGPVAPLMTFSDEKEVVTAANNTEYGLSAYVYTADNSRVHRMGEALEFGEIMFNGVKFGIDLPHGGVKESGIGKDCSQYALEDYVIRKRLTVRC